MNTNRVPSHLIPKLPDTVRPFSDLDLTVKMEFKVVERLDLSEILVSGETIEQAIVHLRQYDIRVRTHRIPAGAKLVIKVDSEGEYEDYSVYDLGYYVVETDAEISERLLNQKQAKLNWLTRKAQKAVDKRAAEARLAAIRETTAEGELELVRALAAKYGLKIEEPSNPNEAT